MDKTTIELRVAQLKAMDDFVHSANDEELVEEWLAYGVPDEASESDFEEIAADDNYYKDCIRMFRAIVKNEDAYY